jgi:hypothetical protein
MLEGKERLTLDCDENLIDICQTVEVFVELLQRLVNVVKSAPKSDADDADDLKLASLKCRGLIARSSIDVLSRPLAQLHLDVEIESPATSTCRKIAENVVKVLIQVFLNFIFQVQINYCGQCQGRLLVLTG